MLIIYLKWSINREGKTVVDLIETDKRVFEKPNFKVHTVTNKGFCLTTDKGVFEVRMG